MDKLDHPEINLSELTAEVRKAMARQVLKGHTVPTNTSAAKGISPEAGAQPSEKDNSTRAIPLPTDMNSDSLKTQLSSLRRSPRFEPQPVFEPNTDNDYHLNDLLKFHDADFLNAAYRAILKREPDSFGYKYYLEQLREGHLDKIDVLAILRFSAEGQLNKVRIDGLALRTFMRRLRHLPVIGYPIRLSLDLLRLPVLIQRLRQYEAYSLGQNRKVADYANEVAEHVDSVNDVLSAAMIDLLNKSEQQLETLIELRREFKTQLDEERVRAQELHDSLTNETRAKIVDLGSTTGDLRARIDILESSANNLRLTTDATQAEIEKVHQQLQHARTELAMQGRRMALILEEAQRRLPAPFDQQQLEIIANEERHKLDALYAELEDNFRGSHEEIKKRFTTYLPHIKSLAITPDLLIVDLGCGRGEWLELLKEEGYRALGVDTNEVLLDRCRARGLEVIDSDILEYLRELPDNSLGAITGFHIIEHLQIEVLMTLLDEIVRTLHPGGVVIFETPNPENVLVGSNYFYFDPTHRNPLPSILMKFLLESRGLHRIEVMNLHAWDQARISGENELTARFNELFYGPMDYAIAGWKVSE
jgi:SAM-dependent methyltransferase